MVKYLSIRSSNGSTSLIVVDLEGVLVLALAVNDIGTIRSHNLEDQNILSI